MQSIRPPDKFNMVDMEGIDILFRYGDIVPGLYQKLVESIAQCRYQCLYNWYFDGVLIPPTYVEMTVIDNKVWIEDGVSVDEEDALGFLAPGLKSVTGAVSHIIDAIAREAHQITCYINPSQEGTGDPSPDNVRPISGWTGANVFGRGKNLFDQDTIYAEYKQADGSFMTSGNAFSVLRYPIPSGFIGKQLTFSAYLRKPDGSNITSMRVQAIVNGVAQRGNLVTSSEYLLSSITFTPETSNDHVALTYGSNGVSMMQAKDLQLELGSSATEFEQYRGTSIPINWQDEAGTIYGGTLDVVMSALTVTDAEIASYNGETLPSTWISDRDVYAAGTTPTIGAQVVYKLAKPLIYNLAAIQVFTLFQGENNIWHNANGDTSVTYWYNKI